MKRLLLVLILVVVLTLTFATPAFAGEGNGPGNMPDDAADRLLEHVRGGSGYPPLDGTLFNGCYTTAWKARPYGVINVAQRAIYYITYWLGGNPPGLIW